MREPLPCERCGPTDGALAEHDEPGSAMISRLLDEVEPDTILTFGPDGITFHPDHITVSRWVTAAWRQRGCRARLLYATSTEDHLARFAEVYEEWGSYMSDERPTGVPTDELAIHLVLEGPPLDRKLTALRAMASQTRELMAMVDPAVYAMQFAEEAFIEAPRPGSILEPVPSGRESARWDDADPNWARSVTDSETVRAQNGD
jgi:LmbE family N-acetylglucosaminyl deacetylase